MIYENSLSIILNILILILTNEFTYLSANKVFNCNLSKQTSLYYFDEYKDQNTLDISNRNLTDALIPLIKLNCKFELSFTEYLNLTNNSIKVEGDELYQKGSIAIYFKKKKKF
jgi:hypothetical protein